MLRTVLLIAGIAFLAALLPAVFANKDSDIFVNVPPSREHTGAIAAGMNGKMIAVARTDVEPAYNPLSGRQARIEMDRNGHFSTDFRLNGRSIMALVDTGATYVAVNTSTARQIGIRLVPSDFKYTVRTANGNVAAAAAMIDEITVGRITVDNVQAAVLPDQALDGTLVGMSFLSQLRSYNVENGALVLEQ
jgi:aspartyl protease family protein